MPKSISELSVDSKILEDKLRTVAVGEMITYAELSKAIGRDVQAEARGNLTTARRRLEGEGRVFDVVHNQGLKHLTDAELAHSGRRGLDHICRSSRRAMRRLAAVQDYATLPRDAQIAHNAAVSVLGMIHLASKSSSLKRLEGRVAEASSTLSLAATLDLMKGAS